MVLRKVVELDRFDKVKMVYNLLFKVNKAKITDMELNIISYIVLNGTISSPPIKNGFIEEFKIHKGTLYNLVSSLQRRGILVKGEDKKIRVNEKITYKFDEKINLIISLHDRETTSK